MQYDDKQKMSTRTLIIKILLLGSILVLLYAYSTIETSNKMFNLNAIAFLYEGDQLVGVNTDDNAKLLEETWTAKAEEVESENTDIEDGTLNTKVVMAPTIVSFSSDESAEEENIQYVKDNTQMLANGLTLTIDDRYKFYIQDESIIDEVVNQILLAYLPDSSYLDYLETTGKFKSYKQGNKTYTGINITNNITVTEGYTSGSKFIETSDDLMFALFHKGQNMQVDRISDEKSIKSIKEENDMTDLQFKLNNPSISDSTVTYNSQPVITNSLKPIIDIAQTYTVTQKQTVKYDVVQEVDDSLLQGQVVIDTEGKNGSKEITYENTVVNGKVVEKTKLDETVINKPVHKVVKVGAGTVTNSVTVEQSDSDGDYTPSASSSSGFIWPSSSTSVTCEFGCYSGHTGIDIQSYYGGPIYAAQSGTVVTSGWSNYGYGYHVIIDHGGGVKTLYAHQKQQPPVYVGQEVTQGQVIGFEGATGNVTGEHLHFEVQINGSAQNPRGYI